MVYMQSSWICECLAYLKEYDALFLLGYISTDHMHLDKYEESMFSE